MVAIAAKMKGGIVLAGRRRKRVTMILTGFWEAIVLSYGERIESHFVRAVQGGNK
jgi:hypothetical protein